MAIKRIGFEFDHGYREMIINCGYSKCASRILRGYRTRGGIVASYWFDFRNIGRKFNIYKYIQ